jgi:hypothetical protein
VNGVLAELVWRELRGSLVRRARLLRQPRYLVSFLATLAYFGLVLRPSFGGFGRHGSRGAGLGAGGGELGMSAGAAADLRQLLLFGASLAIVVAATAMWIFASSKPALALGEADLNLLLPAPLPRRKIVELSIWRQQAGLLAGALVVTLVRGHGSPGVRLGRLVTTWGLLLLLGLHARGVNLWKARLGELPAAAAGRRIALAVGLGVAYWGALAAGLWAAARQLAAAGGLAAAAAGGGAVTGGRGGGAVDTAALWAGVHRLAAAPPPLVSALLAPARWIAVAILGAGRVPGVGPAQDGAWLAAVGFLALAVAANYEWVVRSRARFEDASLERARRLGSRRRRQPALPAAASRQRRSEPFPLPPLGPPELAVYWKNLLAAQRTPLKRRLGLALLPGLALWMGARLFGAPLAVLGSVGATGFLLMALPPIVAGLNQRHGLRGDLLLLEVLRPWPVRGWRLVAAELLAPATTFFSWTLAGFGLAAGSVLAAGHQLAAGVPIELGRLGRQLAASGGVSGGDDGSGPAATLLALALATLLAGVPLTLLSVAAQNLMALALPGWTRIGGEARGTSTLTGARMLALFGHLVALLLGVVPAALLVAVVVLGAAWAGVRPAAWQAPLLALVAGVPLLLEVGLLVRICGARWDRLDPSLELLNPEG